MSRFGQGFLQGLELQQGFKELEQEKIRNQMLEDQILYSRLQDQRAAKLDRVQMDNLLTERLLTEARVEGEQADTQLTKQETKTEKAKTSQERGKAAGAQGTALEATPEEQRREAAIGMAQTMAMQMGVDEKVRDQVVESVLVPRILSGSRQAEAQARELKLENKKLMAQISGERTRNAIQNLDVATGSLNLAAQGRIGAANAARQASGLPPLEQAPGQGVMTSGDMSELRLRQESPPERSRQGTDQVEQRQIREEVRKIRDQISRLESIPMLEVEKDLSWLPTGTTTVRSEPSVDIEIAGQVRTLPRPQALQMLRQELERREKLLQGVTGTNRQRGSGRGGSRSRQRGSNQSQDNDPLGIR